MAPLWPKPTSLVPQEFEGLRAKREATLIDVRRPQELLHEGQVQLLSGPISHEQAVVK